MIPSARSSGCADHWGSPTGSYPNGFYTKDRQNESAPLCGAPKRNGKRSIILSLIVLSGGFRLLLTLQAGANIMLSLLNLSDNAILRTAALKSLERTLQRLIFFYADLRHDFPSLRCISQGNAIRAIRWLFLLYARNAEMSSTNLHFPCQNTEKLT